MAQSPGGLGTGRRRTLVALMLATGILTVGEGAFNVLLAPHLQQQGLSQAMIGTVVATFSVTALLGRPLTSYLYTARRSAVIVAVGCVTSALAYVGVSQSSLPLTFAALLGAHGIGVALSTTGGMAAIMDVSGGSKPGSLMGWYTGAIGAGYAVAAFLGGASGDLLGLSQAILAIASLPVVAGVLLAIVLTLSLRPGGRGGSAKSAPDEGASETRGDYRQPQTMDRSERIRRLAKGPPSVWLASAVALHINLLNGFLTTYFPLYALSVGLSLTQVGVLLGVHSIIGSAVRFLAPAIFRYVQPRQVLSLLVVVGGCGVAVMASSSSMLLLGAISMVIGFARGLLRVSSAALVMEATTSADGTRGVGSGIYLAGLDAGKIIGPALGGLLVQAFGYAFAFVLAGLGFPLVYVELSRRLRRGRREADATP